MNTFKTSFFSFAFSIGPSKHGDQGCTKMAAYLIDTGRPGLDFMSQSTDTNLPS